MQTMNSQIMKSLKLDKFIDKYKNAASINLTQYPFSKSMSVSQQKSKKKSFQKSYMSLQNLKNKVLKKSKWSEAMMRRK